MKRPLYHMTDIPVATSVSLKPHRSCGFTLIECILAMGLLIGFTAMTIPLIVRLQETRQEQFRRQLALTEVQNLLESKAFPDHGEVELQDSLRRWLPDAEIELKQTPGNSAQDGDQVTVSIRWKTDSEMMSRPVVLTTWRFRNPMESAPSSDEKQE